MKVILKIVLFLGLTFWQAVAAPNPLLGHWVAQTHEGRVQLEIVSEKSLVYDGEVFACTIDAQAIYVEDESGVTPYPYSLSGEGLEIMFPEGVFYTFVRTEKQPMQTTKPQQDDGAQNYLLQGKYCTYSGSSGSGGSFSSSNWAWFDGSGSFRYGSGSYYTGYGDNSGDLYGNERDSRDMGTYTVEGNAITLHLPDGSTTQAQVFERTANGRVTGFQHGKLLYSPTLCD